MADNDPRRDRDQRGTTENMAEDKRPLAQRDQRRRGGEEIGEDPAAGTVTSPVSPGEAQAGDRGELAANLGGPVDVFPGRDRGRTERP
jgi:hypothetical protein